MTQKEALKNVLKGMEHSTARKFAILEWLEDINWHTEYNIFYNRLSEYEQWEMEAVQDTLYILYPQSFCTEFVEEFYEKSNLYPRIRESLIEKFNKDEPILIYKYSNANYIKERGEYMSPSAIRDYELGLSFIRTFNRIFEWSIIAPDWESKGHGEEFVDELEKLLLDISLEWD